MSRLTVSLLGPFQATLDGRPLDNFRTSKVQALLIYLLLHALEHADQGVGREHAMTLLWPEMPRKSAQVNLRQTLYHLRQAIPDVDDNNGEPVPFILSDRQTLRINPAARYELDVAAFVSLVNEGDREQLAAAVDLYRGDFLADFYLEDSSEFETWAARWRSRLQRQMLEALDQLMAGELARRQPREAAVYARRALAIDELRESAHRGLIQALGQMDKQADAIRQYERCRSLLQEQLGVAPSDETETVIAAIRRGGQQRRQLPAPETPIIGREKELADVMGLLSDGARLVSIVGPGGIGKTRLALEVAWSVAPKDKNEQPLSIERVIFVNLAPLSEVEEFAPTIARALEPAFNDVDQETLRRQLLEYLQGQKLLLVLDNFEHLLEKATLLKEMLRAAPDVRILVTSRERLKLQAEHVYPLSGLAYSQWTTPVEAARDPAVQLFQQQARRVRPAFRLRSKHLAPLHKIVQLTEGMPLALILAAGWVQVMGPAEIAAELGRSLDFLEATHRDLPPRQRSMRAVFGAMWERLSERERAIFAALSVFRGGFTLDAARAVTGATSGDLMRLADRSLITRVEDGRFEVHELLRQFAAERLEAGEEAETVRHAHSVYYCAFIEERVELLKGPQVDEATAEITADLENVRVAFILAARKGQGILTWNTISGLALFYYRRFLLREGPALFQQALKALSGNTRASSRTRAMLLIWWSYVLAANPSRRRQEERQARRALAFYEQAAKAGEDVREEEAWAHMAVGQNRKHQSPQSAARHFTTSLALFTQLDRLMEMATAHNRLGATYLQMADYQQAYEHRRMSSQLYEQAGHWPFALIDKLQAAMMGACMGRLQEAEAVLRKGLAQYQERDDRPYVGYTQMMLGHVLILSGQFQDGLCYLAKSLESQSTWDIVFYESYSRSLSCWATLHLGQYRKAQEEAALLLGASREENIKYGIGSANLVLGCALLAQNEFDEARIQFKESATTFQAIDRRDEASWVQVGLGCLALKKGDAGAARKHLVKALRYVPDYQHYMCALMALPAAALLFAMIGEKERAVELYTLAGKHGFVANSRWIEDMAGRRIAAVAESLPAEDAAAARARGKVLELWETVGALLTELKGLELAERS